MPIHPFQPLRGRIEIIQIDSTAFKDNFLGDPFTRQIAVYLPPDYDSSNTEYPLFVDLVGFTGSGFSHLNWKAYTESLPQRLERLVDEGKMGPVVCALPDCFTSMGGNQYINSSVMGMWADFLIGDMIPALEARFRVKKGRENRACFGKSSGGYGSVVHGMRYANAWGAIASHSGDMGFDWVYRNDFPRTLDKLAKHDGISGFMEHIRTSQKISSGAFHTLMTLAMAATYDPNPALEHGIQLPVDMRTCRLDSERWAQWLSHDPMHMIEEQSCQESLRSLKAVYIDCGSRDQYLIHYGARQLTARLDDL
ncbi:MAG TPA: enterochelin esterase, partial [Myxococcales bacterium]|nr:enterochelin esterase [Myxococcales bacterium]